MADNPFATQAAARLYALGRPDYSDLVTDIIRRLTGITGRIPVAVDVGSGTGISTRALSPLADTVIGVEPSTAMLERASPVTNVAYRVGFAEDLPMEDESCDLIFTGSALHWFDQELFLSETARIARPGAHLVVHDHWFTGQIQDDENFGTWTRDVYLTAYPPPPRDRSWRPPADLGDWRHTGWESYDHPVPLTSDQLATYLLSQSNLQTVIERNQESEEHLRSWIADETAPFFDDAGAAVFLFCGFVACHQR